MACLDKLSLYLCTDTCVTIQCASSSAVVARMWTDVAFHCFHDSLLHPFPHSVGTPFLTAVFYVSALHNNCPALFLLMQEPPPPLLEVASFIESCPSRAASQSHFLIPYCKFPFLTSVSFLRCRRSRGLPRVTSGIHRDTILILLSCGLFNIRVAITSPC
jgi:hypothetical protein